MRRAVIIFSCWVAAIGVATLSLRGHSQETQPVVATQPPAPDPNLTALQQSLDEVMHAWVNSRAALLASQGEVKNLNAAVLGLQQARAKCEHERTGALPDPNKKDEAK